MGKGDQDSGGKHSRPPAPKRLPKSFRSRADLRPELPERSRRPGAAGGGEHRWAGSPARESRRRPPCARSGDWLPFTADSQVPRRNFALHMRRSWLVQCRGWGRRPPSSAPGMACGSLGKRRPTSSPIHKEEETRRGFPSSPKPDHRRWVLERPVRSRRRPRSPRPAHRAGRVVRDRHCNPTLHPRPAPGRWALEPVSRLPPPLPGPGRSPAEIAPSSS